MDSGLLLGSKRFDPRNWDAKDKVQRGNKVLFRETRDPGEFVSVDDLLQRAYAKLRIFHLGLLHEIWTERSDDRRAGLPTGAR